MPAPFFENAIALNVLRTKRTDIESNFGTEFAKAFDYEVNKNNNYVPLKQNEKKNVLKILYGK